MRAIRCLLAAVLGAGIVTMVAAQPGGGFRFGGGFDVNDLVFTNAVLQEEIKVTDAQKEKIKPISEKLAELSKKRGEMFGGGGKGKFDKEKFAEIQEEGKKVAEEQKKVFDDVFTDAQKKRLKQIRVQQMSFRVFNDPEAKGGGGGGGRGFVSEEQKTAMKEVQEALKLSDSQKSSIKGITADYNKESDEIYKDAGVSRFPGFGKGKDKDDAEKREAANKKVEKVRKEAWTKVEEVFDDTQKKTWKDLTGTVFDTSKLLQTPTPAPKRD